MASQFEGFVVLADMRTGSNLLQETLNAYAGLHCDGELFNPGFIGSADQTEAYGMSLAERDADPLALLARQRRTTSDLTGFRLFPDHDARVTEHLLRDRRTAKIILTRNPMDTYISLKTARETGQWWLGDIRLARSASPAFDAHEFDAFLARRSAAQDSIRRMLQITGQTAFHIHYDDLDDEKVLGGLIRFLGISPRREGSAPNAKVQNPGPLLERIANFDEVERGLRQVDLLDLSRHPDFEPRRGANVASYFLASKARLIMLLVPGVHMSALVSWLTVANGGEAPAQGFARKQLRQWKRSNPGHRSFAVVSHPGFRAYQAFCKHILSDGPDSFSAIRQYLIDVWGFRPPQPDASPEIVADAYLLFLDFLKANLNRQTGVRVPAVWASQATLIKGMTDVILLDSILRYDDLAKDLAQWSGPDADLAAEAAQEGPWPEFAAVHSDAVERAARTAYPRDFMMFGFEDWTGGGQAA